MHTIFNFLGMILIAASVNQLSRTIEKADNQCQVVQKAEEVEVLPPLAVRNIGSVRKPVDELAGETE